MYTGPPPTDHYMLIAAGHSNELPSTFEYHIIEKGWKTMHTRRCAVQRQTAVIAHFSSKQLLLFAYALY